MHGPGKWFLVGLATALIAIGIAAQTGSPGHPPPRAKSGGVRAAQARLPTPSGGPVQISWKSLGGMSTSSTAVTSWGDDRLDVFIRGSDHAIWHDAWIQGTWTGWFSLGGAFASGPSAVSSDRNRIDVFARGLDEALWHLDWDGSRWSEWQSLGGLIKSTPAVTSSSATRLDVLTLGADGALWHISRTGADASWSPWQRVGEQFEGDPAAVSPADGRIDVFVHGLDDTLWQASWDGSTWSGWTSRGGRLASSPAVAACSRERLHAFVVGSNGSTQAWISRGNSGSWADVGPGMIGLAAICQKGAATIALFGVAADRSVQMATLRIDSP